VTNHPDEMVIGLCSALGRRIRDLADDYAHQLGGWPALSVTQAGDVRRAAELSGLAELERAKRLRGEGDAKLSEIIRLDRTAALAVRRFTRARG
jgi:hypothetical protein